MRTWKHIGQTVFSLAMLFAIGGAGCVITIEPDPPGGGNGGGDGGGGTATTLRIRLINATGTTLDPELFVAAGPVTIDELFAAGNQVTRFGVGTLGLLGPLGSDTVTRDCADSIVIGTNGGSFGDDLENPDGNGRRIVLTQDVNVSCGDTITFTFTQSGSGFDTEFDVSR